jgi:hypothetical protein
MKKAIEALHPSAGATPPKPKSRPRRSSRRPR